jgi:peptide/nickel transport system permease protein
MSEQSRPDELGGAAVSAPLQPGAPDAGAAAGADVKESASKPRSLPRRVWGQSEGRVGVILTGIIVVLAFLGPVFAPILTGYSPTEFADRPFQTTGLFGTDDLGRSVASRFLAGGMLLVLYSVAATAIGMVVGAAFGIIAAYTGGAVDAIIMRVNDVLLAIPQLVFAMLAIVVLGPQGWVLILVIGLTHAPRIARVARAATLSVINEDYIRAAEMYAMPRWRIILREIVPNITGPLSVEAGLRLTYSIGSIASLSFLGLGMQPPTADWGLMINENRIALSVQPWGVILPVAAIAVLMIGTNLLADAIARANASTNVGNA